MPKGSGIDNMVSKLPAVPYGDATLSQPHLWGLVLQYIQTGQTTWHTRHIAQLHALNVLIESTEDPPLLLNLLCPVPGGAVRNLPQQTDRHR